MFALRALFLLTVWTTININQMGKSPSMMAEGYKWYVGYNYQDSDVPVYRTVVVQQKQPEFKGKIYHRRFARLYYIITIGTGSFPPLFGLVGIILIAAIND